MFIWWFSPRLLIFLIKARWTWVCLFRSDQWAPQSVIINGAELLNHVSCSLNKDFYICGSSSQVLFASVLDHVHFIWDTWPCSCPVRSSVSSRSAEASSAFLPARRNLSEKCAPIKTSARVCARHHPSGRLPSPAACLFQGSRCVRARPIIQCRPRRSRHFLWTPSDIHPNFH